jgi:hypothetical protein
MSAELPKWAEEEINSITDFSFKEFETYEGTGYFLEIDEKNRMADIQFYEKLPIGQHIVTAIIPNEIKLEDLMKGFVYAYKVKILKAPLSSKLIEYLKENLNIERDGVYRFEVESLELLDVDAGLASASGDEETEE